MKTVNLLKKSFYLILTLAISLNFTSCSQEEGINTPPQEPQEKQLTIGQRHNQLLDCALKAIKEDAFTRNGLVPTPYQPGGFYKTPMAIGTLAMRKNVIETENVSAIEVDSWLEEVMVESLDLSEEILAIEQSKSVTLSDMIDFNSFSFADKLILQILENILNTKYDSVQQQITEINVLQGLTGTEEVINILDIAANSIEYWEANIDEWEEVVAEAGPTRGKGTRDYWIEVAFADIVGAFFGKQVDSNGKRIPWWKIGLRATYASFGNGTIKFNDQYVRYDQQMIFDDGTPITKKQMQVTMRDEYVQIKWDN